MASKVDDDSILYSHDFQTGVKSLLIDKPSTEPCWNPSTLELISDKTVDWYFRPLNLHKEDQDGVVFVNSINYDEYPTQYGLPSRQTVFDAYSDLSNGCSRQGSSFCYNYQGQEYLKAKRIQTGKTPVKASTIHEYVIGTAFKNTKHSKIVDKMVDWALGVDFVTVSGGEAERMVIPK